MNSTLFYTTSLGPPVGVPSAMYAPPLRYKREALAVQNRLPRTHTHRLAKALADSLEARQYNAQWT